MDVNEVVEALALRTGRRYGENPVAIGGGSVGFAFRFDVDNEPVFVKIGQAEQLVMFEAEAEGLKALSEASALKVPDVLDCGAAGKWSYLAMDWLELGPKSSRAEQSLEISVDSRLLQIGSAGGLDKPLGRAKLARLPTKDSRKLAQKSRFQLTARRPHRHFS